MPRWGGRRERPSTVPTLVPFVVAVAMVALGLGLEARPAAAAATSGGLRPLVPTRLLDTRVPGQGPALAGNEVRHLTVGGRAGVPVGAEAVALNVTVTDPTAFGFLSVFPAGRPWPGSSSLNFRPGQIVPNMVVTGLGAAGQIAILNSAGASHVIVDVLGFFTGGFRATTPARLLDTRLPGQGPALGWGEARRLAIAGRAGVPAGAVAVAVNVTAVTPTVPGFLSVYPATSGFPGTSSLNFTAGQVVANLVLVGLGQGAVTLFNASGATHVVVDLTGWFTDGFHPVVPSRVADTRDGRCGVRLGHGDRRHIAIAGRGGVPNSGATAVALNVTATNPTATSFLTVYPKGSPTPLASNLNVVRGQTVPNLVVSGIGEDGAITILNALGTVDVVVDVTGWFAGGAPPNSFDCAVLDAPPPLAPPGFAIPPGSFAVGTEIPAGRYRAAGGPACTWWRVGRAGELLASGGGRVRPLVDVLATDGRFQSGGCGAWVAYFPAAAQATVVGDGDWVVSEDLPPGVYANTAAAPCRWEQRMGFSHRPGELLDDGLSLGTAFVELAPFEVGFRSQGCGLWRWLGPPTP